MKARSSARQHIRRIGVLACALLLTAWYVSLWRSAFYVRPGWAVGSADGYVYWCTHPVEWTAQALNWIPKTGPYIYTVNAHGWETTTTLGDPGLTMPRAGRTPWGVFLQIPHWLIVTLVAVPAALAWRSGRRRARSTASWQTRVLVGFGTTICLCLFVTSLLSLRYSAGLATRAHVVILGSAALEIGRHGAPDVFAENMDLWCGRSDWHGWRSFAHSASWPRWYSAQGRWILTIPLWMFFLAVLVPTAIMWYRIRSCIVTGYCLDCGYDLRGNVSGRCPECGAAISTQRTRPGTST
jgi:hypothetical protein